MSADLSADNTTISTLLSVSGNTILNTMNVGGTASLGSTLSVNNTAYFNNNVVTKTDLSVGGLAQIQSGALSGTLSVNGDTTLKKVTVNDTATMSDIVSSSTLSIAGNVIMKTNLSVGGSTKLLSGVVSSGLSVAGNTTLEKGVMSSTLSVGGVSTLKEVVVNNDLSVGGEVVIAEQKGLTFKLSDNKSWEIRPSTTDEHLELIYTFTDDDGVLKRTVTSFPPAN